MHNRHDDHLHLGRIPPLGVWIWRECKQLYCTSTHFGNVSISDNCQRISELVDNSPPRMSDCGTITVGFVLLAWQKIGKNPSAPSYINACVHKKMQAAAFSLSSRCPKMVYDHSLSRNSTSSPTSKTTQIPISVTSPRQTWRLSWNSMKSVSFSGSKMVWEGCERTSSSVSTGKTCPEIANRLHKDIYTTAI